MMIWIKVKLVSHLTEQQMVRIVFFIIYTASENARDRDTAEEDVDV